MIMPNDLPTEDKTPFLTQEQEALLELYLQNLDERFERLKEEEQLEVEVETLHLKRILTK